MAKKDQAATPRKRTRKRKRRNVSVSSGSSSSDDDSVTDSREVPKSTRAASPNTSELDSDDSETDLSCSSDSESAELPQIGNNKAFPEVAKTSADATESAQDDESLSMRPVPEPTLVGQLNSDEREKELKKRFREFWMTNIADGFADDLDQLRKEPNMSSSRLALFIDSLASGADIYGSYVGPDGDTVNEMELILDD